MGWPLSGSVHTKCGLVLPNKLVGAISTLNWPLEVDGTIAKGSYLLEASDKTRVNSDQN